eukprot:748265-Hanusia_phi.AAC.5
MLKLARCEISDKMKRYREKIINQLARDTQAGKIFANKITTMTWHIPCLLGLNLLSSHRMLAGSVYMTERPAVPVFGTKEAFPSPQHELDIIARDMFSLVQELRRMSQDIGHRPISRSRVYACASIRTSHAPYAVADELDKTFFRLKDWQSRNSFPAPRSRSSLVVARSSKEKREQGSRNLSPVPSNVRFTPRQLSVSFSAPQSSPSPTTLLTHLPKSAIVREREFQISPILGDSSFSSPLFLTEEEKHLAGMEMEGRQEQQVEAGESSGEEDYSYTLISRSLHRVGERKRADVTSLSPAAAAATPPPHYSSIHPASPPDPFSLLQVSAPQPAPGSHLHRLPEQHSSPLTSVSSNHFPHGDGKQGGARGSPHPLPLQPLGSLSKQLGHARKVEERPAGSAYFRSPATCQQEEQEKGEGRSREVKLERSEQEQNPYTCLNLFITQPSVPKLSIPTKAKVFIPVIFLSPALLHPFLLLSILSFTGSTDAV